MKNTRSIALAAVAAVALLGACAPKSDTAASAAPTAAATATDTYTKDTLATLTPGTLTIATGEPAYYP